MQIKLSASGQVVITLDDLSTKTSESAEAVLLYNILLNLSQINYLAQQFAAQRRSPLDINSLKMRL